MVFRLRKSLISSCPFTRILASPLTPILYGLKKFRWIVSRFRKTSPQGDPFPLLIDENCRLSHYELEYITGIPKTTVHDKLVSHLGRRNVYSLTSLQKSIKQLEACWPL